MGNQIGEKGQPARHVAAAIGSLHVRAAGLQAKPAGARPAVTVAAAHVAKAIQRQKAPGAPALGPVALAPAPKNAPGAKHVAQAIQRQVATPLKAKAPAAHLARALERPHPQGPRPAPSAPVGRPAAGPVQRKAAPAAFFPPPGQRPAAATRPAAPARPVIQRAEDPAAADPVDYEESLASGMETFVGGGFEWGPYAVAGMRNIGAEKKKPFTNWLYFNGAAPRVMNCWESVLYAAFTAGLVDKTYIKKAILPSKDKTGVTFVKKVFASQTGNVSGGNGRDLLRIPVDIPRGYVVVFGSEGQHVALSAGGQVANKNSDAIEQLGKMGHGLLELDSATEGVVLTTIEDVQARSPSYSRTISWGPFPRDI